MCPVIDVIDDDTLEFHFSNAAGTSVGGFDWNLQVNALAFILLPRCPHSSSLISRMKAREILSDILLLFYYPLKVFHFVKSPLNY